MSDRSIFESEKEKAENFQPTKKCRTKPSGLKRYHWKSILKEYVPKIPTTQWAVLAYNGLCRAQSQPCSAVLKAKTESMNTSIKVLDQSLVEDLTV